MTLFKSLVGTALLGLVVAAAGCSSAQIDADDEETQGLAEATEELSINGILEGPLVLQETPLGAWTYDTLAKRWLKWAMAAPFSSGPINDTTGEACGLGQSGPVWFLAGTSGGDVTRSCTIPKFKALHFPLINIWSTPPAEFVDEPAELADFVGFFQGYFPEWRAAVCSLTLRVDGQDVLADTAERDAKLWTDILDPFPVTLNDDNYAGLPGGAYPAALYAGHHALLLPLPPGDHTLEFGGAQCEGGDVVFEVSAVYDLHIGN